MIKHDYSQMDSSPEGLRKYIAWLRFALKGSYHKRKLERELERAKRKLQVAEQFAEYLYCAPCIVGGRFTENLFGY